MTERLLPQIEIYCQSQHLHLRFEVFFSTKALLVLLRLVCV